MLNALLATCAFAADPAVAEASAEPAPVALGAMFVEAHVPAEIRVDRRPVAQLYVPATVEIAIPVGNHELSVLVGGESTLLAMVVPPAPERALILVGRTGTTVRTDARPITAEATRVPVELRGSGPGPVQIRIAADRYQIDAGSTFGLSLATGEYPVSVRSPDGTAIWATGRLRVSGGDIVVVQIGEGRLPEVSGAGVFIANGG
jgi:hypothetical protein